MHEQPLLPGPAIRALGDADQLERPESELLELGMHFVDLAQAAVDEQHIRRHDFARPAPARSAASSAWRSAP